MGISSATVRLKDVAEKNRMARFEYNIVGNFFLAKATIEIPVLRCLIVLICRVCVELW